MVNISKNKKKIFSAGAWVFGAFILSQLLRLSSNLVVTRLLEPEMFGVMTLVFTVLIGIAMFTDAGLWAFLVRHENGDKEKIYNVVWTVQVIRGFFIFLIIFLVSLFSLIFLSSDFKSIIGIYGSDDFLLVIMVVSLTALISGFTNMGHAIDSRSLKRGKIEIIELVSQLTGVFVMVLWAYLQPSIWALASSAIVASLIKLILSNIYFPYKHKFSFDKKVVREVYDFGKWVYFSSILTYLAMQFDKVFFGANLKPELLGVYGIAVLIMGAILTLISSLVGKVLYPMYANMQKDKIRMKAAYYKSRVLLDFFIISMAICIYLYSVFFIEILYDDRYKEAGKMMKYLAITLPGVAITSVSLDLLSAIGQTKIRMKVMLVRAVSIVVMLPALFDFFGIYGAIFAVAINPYLAFPIIVCAGVKEELMNYNKELFLFFIPVIIFTILYFAGF